MTEEHKPESVYKNESDDGYLQPTAQSIPDYMEIKDVPTEYYIELTNNSNKMEIKKRTESKPASYSKEANWRNKTKFLVGFIVVVTAAVSVGLGYTIFFFQNDTSGLIRDKIKSVCSRKDCGSGKCFLNESGRTVCVCPPEKTGEKCESNIFRISDIRTECPSGWYTYATWCYKDYTTKKTWQQSRDFCRSSGADLLSVHDQDEMEFVTGHILQPSLRYWIGLSNLNKKGNFFWSDGYELDYQNWAPNETHGIHGHKNCVQIGSETKGTWSANNCFMSSNLICKQRKTIECAEGHSHSWYYFNGSCYLFHNEESLRNEIINTSLSWIEARTVCKEERADLTIIQTRNEYRFLLSHLTKFDDDLLLWIGLNDFIKRGRFRWVDATLPDSEFWNVSEHKHRCVGISLKNGNWEGSNCGDKNGFICERSVIF